MVISLVGPNVFTRQRELHKIVGSAPSYRIVGEDGLIKWYEQLGQSDLFGQSPSIIADRVVEDLPKPDQKTLAEYLNSQGALASEQQIVFIIENEKSMAKSPLGEMLSRHKILRLPKPDPAKLGLWVQQEAMRLNVAISKPLIQELINRLGADQFAIQTELEKWSLHTPAEITAQDLHSIAALNPDSDTFGLTTAWEHKNPSKALSLLAQLRLQGTADQMIVGMLGWKIESLLVASNKRQRAGRWSQQQLEAAMTSLYQYDLKVKQGKIDPEVGLELWLVQTINQSDN